MKKLILIFCLLAAVFTGIFIFKSTRPTEGTTQTPELLWWEKAPGEKPTPDDRFVLPSEIPVPENFIPMINRENTFMEIGEDGKVVSYKKAVEGEDGVWLWKTIEDLNIPDDYEAVEGLENVYRTKDEAGEYHYLKYTRNDDNTFFFTDVDEKGNPIQNLLPDTADIPDNFVRLDNGKNIFAIYDDHGVLNGYAERMEEDGDYLWQMVDEPLDMDLDIPVVTPPTPPAPTQAEKPSGPVDIVIQTEDPEAGYYKETQTVTSIEHKDGMVYVYESVITMIYKDGELYSSEESEKELVNSYPETEINGGIPELTMPSRP